MWKASCNVSETAKAEIMADTSLHALMRHQYQRRISTVPVPAPVTISSFHAPAIEPMKYVRIADTIVRKTVATCDMLT